ncbi:hypothetical protein [Caenispirillum bisanense]|uniref:hypothetical protein n=1 Tax=Caenispirillum bisanense TaxID=414052 RepID=UPI000BE332D3|nr:hypothetical protein [Caenispirillum bisanense]
MAERGKEAAHTVIQQVVDAALARAPLKPAVELAEEQEKEPPRQALRRKKAPARAAGMAMRRSHRPGLRFRPDLP